MDLDEKDATNAGATNTPRDSMLMEVPSFGSTIKSSADIPGARSLGQPRVGQLSKVEDTPQDEYQLEHREGNMVHDTKDC